GCGDERIGFFERCGDGFLDEDVNPLLEQAAAHACVFDSWDGEADGVNIFGERGNIGEHSRAEFGGDGGGALGVDIHDAHEFDAWHFAPDANVIASEIADADDGNANEHVAHFVVLGGAATGGKA